MKNFTSLSPEEEQRFVVFERRSVNTARAAMTLAFIIAGALFVTTVMVVFAFKPDKLHNVVDEADAKAKAKEEAKVNAAVTEEKPDEGESEALSEDDTGEKTEE